MAKFSDPPARLLRLIGGNVRMPRGYGNGTEETIHKSVWIHMKVVLN